MPPTAEDTHRRMIHITEKPWERDSPFASSRSNLNIKNRLSMPSA